MQSHDLHDADGSRASDRAAGHPVELRILNNRSPPSPYRTPYQQQQQPLQPQPHVDAQGHQYSYLPDDGYVPPSPYLYPDQDRYDRRYSPSPAAQGPATDFSRPLASPRHNPVYQSAHTSSTAVNSEDNFATPAWALNLQNGSSGFLTESHNAYGYQSDVSSRRNSARASTIDLAYLKRHRPLASMADSRPVTPTIVSPATGSPFFLGYSSSVPLHCPFANALSFLFRRTRAVSHLPGCCARLQSPHSTASGSFRAWWQAYTTGTMSTSGRVGAGGCTGLHPI